jgi:hypothetical protein
MADTMEARLAAAAEAAREYEVTGAQRRSMRGRLDAATREVESLQSQLTEQQRDVRRLEGLSLTSVVARLRGSREDALAREQAEVDACRYRLAHAQAQLEVLRTEDARLAARSGELAEAPAAYVAVLAEKEAYLSSSGDPRAARLLELAQERGRLGAELREIREARGAADRALRALSIVEDKLDSASGWSTYDTFLGGGAVASAVKHSRMDEAAAAAAEADQCLSVLRAELADIRGPGPTAPSLQTDGLVRFVDIWFDNIFTDLSVRNRIQTAQRNVLAATQRVQQIDTALRKRAEADQARFSDVERERRSLLTG